MIDSKEENFLVFETRLAGRRLPVACLLLFGGAGLAMGWGSMAWGPLGVLMKLHPQGPGWRGRGELGQPLGSCAGTRWPSCWAVPSGEAPGPVPSEPLTVTGLVCRGKEAQGPGQSVVLPGPYR